MNKNNKRGFTLAELTVVLAVLVIVSAMVVSFTVMVTNSRQLSSARLDALSDVRVAETLIEGFIEGNAHKIEISETELTVKEEEVITKKLTFNKNEEEQGGTLTITGGETDTTITLDRVTEITFDYYGEDTDKIYYCTVKYNVGNHNYDYTFCVNPYVGETIGGN